MVKNRPQAGRQPSPRPHQRSTFQLVVKTRACLTVSPQLKNSGIGRPKTTASGPSSAIAALQSPARHPAAGASTWHPEMKDARPTPSHAGPDRQSSQAAGLR